MQQTSGSEMLLFLLLIMIVQQAAYAQEVNITTAQQLADAVATFGQTGRDTTLRLWGDITFDNQTVFTPASFTGGTLQIVQAAAGGSCTAGPQLAPIPLRLGAVRGNGSAVHFC